MGAAMIATELGREAYITQANAAGIIRRIAPQSLSSLTGMLYARPISLFSRAERVRLLAIRNFFEDAEKFIDHHCRGLSGGRQDPNLVFPDGDPAYHLLPDCPYLYADYRNVEIPPQIRIRGARPCGEFRAWFMAHAALYEERPGLFLVMLSTRFGIRLGELKMVERLNSGSTRMRNENLDAVACQIDRLLDASAAFMASSDAHRAILGQYRHHAYLGYRAERLHANRTGRPDSEVKALLREFNERYKIPLKRHLTSYFRVVFNPELVFSGYLMERLGLRPCRHCCRHSGTGGKR